MGILPIVLGLAAGICIGSGMIYLFIGCRRRDERSPNLTFSQPLPLNLDMENYALLLYSR